MSASQKNSEDFISLSSDSETDEDDVCEIVSPPTKAAPGRDASPPARPPTPPKARSIGSLMPSHASRVAASLREEAVVALQSPERPVARPRPPTPPKPSTLDSMLPSHANRLASVRSHVESNRDQARKPAASSPLWQVNSNKKTLKTTRKKAGTPRPNSSITRKRSRQDNGARTKETAVDVDASDDYNSPRIARRQMIAGGPLQRQTCNGVASRADVIISILDDTSSEDEEAEPSPQREQVHQQEQEEEARKPAAVQPAAATRAVDTFGIDSSDDEGVILTERLYPAQQRRVKTLQTQKEERRLNALQNLSGQLYPRAVAKFEAGAAALGGLRVVPKGGRRMRAMAEAASGESGRRQEANRLLRAAREQEMASSPLSISKTTSGRKQRSMSEAVSVRPLGDLASLSIKQDPSSVEPNNAPKKLGHAAHRFEGVTAGEPGISVGAGHEVVDSGEESVPATTSYKGAPAAASLASSSDDSLPESSSFKSRSVSALDPISDTKLPALPPVQGANVATTMKEVAFKTEMQMTRPRKSAKASRPLLGGKMDSDLELVDEEEAIKEWVDDDENDGEASSLPSDHSGKEIEAADSLIKLARLEDDRYTNPLFQFPEPPVVGDVEPDHPCSMSIVESMSKKYLDKETGLPVYELTVYGGDDSILYSFRLHVKDSSIPGAGNGAFLTYLGARELSRSSKEYAKQVYGDVVHDLPPTMEPLEATIGRKNVSVALKGKGLHGPTDGAYRPTISYPIPAVISEADCAASKIFTKREVTVSVRTNSVFSGNRVDGGVGFLGIHTQSAYFPTERNFPRAQCVDLGRYGPFKPTDRKIDDTFVLKSFIFDHYPSEWCFEVEEELGEGNLQIIDITDDETGMPHDVAQKNVPMYVNEVGYNSSLEETVFVKEVSGRVVHYFFYREKYGMKKGQTLELFVNYRSTYEEIRERKGYGWTNLNGGVKSDDEDPNQRLERNFIERCDVEHIICLIQSPIQLEEHLNFIFYKIFLPLEKKLFSTTGETKDSQIAVANVTSRQLVALMRIVWLSDLFANQVDRLALSAPKVSSTQSEECAMQVDSVIPTDLFEVNAELGIPATKATDAAISDASVEASRVIFECSIRRCKLMIGRMRAFPFEKVYNLVRSDIHMRHTLNMEFVEEICHPSIPSPGLVRPLDRSIWCHIATDLIQSLSVLVASTGLHSIAAKEASVESRRNQRNNESKTEPDEVQKRQEEDEARTRQTEEIRKDLAKRFLDEAGSAAKRVSVGVESDLTFDSGFQVDTTVLGPLDELLAAIGAPSDLYLKNCTIPKGFKTAVIERLAYFDALTLAGESSCCRAGVAVKAKNTYVMGQFRINGDDELLRKVASVPRKVVDHKLPAVNPTWYIVWQVAYVVYAFADTYLNGQLPINALCDKLDLDVDLLRFALKQMETIDHKRTVFQDYCGPIVPPTVNKFTSGGTPGNHSAFLESSLDLEDEFTSEAEEYSSDSSSDTEMHNLDMASKIKLRRRGCGSPRARSTQSDNLESTERSRPPAVVHPLSPQAPLTAPATKRKEPPQEKTKHAAPKKPKFDSSLSANGAPPATNGRQGPKLARKKAMPRGGSRTPTPLSPIAKTGTVPLSSLTASKSKEESANTATTAFPVLIAPKEIPVNPRTKNPSTLPRETVDKEITTKAPKGTPPTAAANKNPPATNSGEKSIKAPKSTPLTAVRKKSPATNFNGKSQARLIYEGVPKNTNVEWPAGWTQKTFERAAGASKGQTDDYWFAPVTKFRLRSIANVREFFHKLEICNGDEVEAIKSFKAK